MSADRSEYQLKINMATDASSTDKALADLAARMTSAKKTGSELVHETTRINSAHASLESKARKAGEGVKEFEVKNKEAAHAIHLLGDAISQVDPTLGGVTELARMARSPEFLVPAAALIAWTALDQGVKAVVEQIKQAIEWTRKLEDAQREATEEAASAARAEAQAFETRLRHQFDEFNALKVARENLLGLYKSEQDHVESLHDAEIKRFEDYISYLVKIGAMNPQKADDKKAQLDQEAADAKERTEEHKKQAEINTKKGDVADAKQKEVEASFNLPDARAAKTAADAAARKNQKDTVTEQKKFDNLDKAASEAEDRAALIEAARRTYGNKSSTTAETLGADAEMTKLIFQDFQAGKMIGTQFAIATPKSFALGAQGESDISEARGLRGAADQQQGHIEKMKANQDALDQAVKDAQSNVDQWAKVIEESRKSIHDLTEAIEKETAELILQKKDYADTRRANIRGTEAEAYYKNGPADQESADLFKTFSEEKSSNRLMEEERTRRKNEAWQKVLREAEAAMTAASLHQANEATFDAVIEHLMAIFASHAELNAATTAKIEELEKEMREQKQIFKNNRYGQ